ncbi:MAG: hypothetical protein JNL08_10015 [Planctomycetes bacterium]|nr:hypothetical protein [Planctomycetota bacterium]
MHFPTPFVRGAVARTWAVALAVAGRWFTFLMSAALGTVAAAQCAATWSPADTGYGIDGPGANGEGAVSAVVRWDPDGPGPLGERIAFGGSFYRLGIWAQNLVTLDPTTGRWSAPGTAVSSPVVRLLAMRNGDLIANHSSNYIYRLRGGVWTHLTSFSFSVFDMEEMSNGDLAVASGGTVRRWNGTTWSQLGPNLTNVRELAVRPDGTLVALETMIVSPFVRLLEFNGSTWVPMALSGPLPPAHDLSCLSNGDLVALDGGTTPASGTDPVSVVRETPIGWVILGTVTDGLYAPSIYDLTVLPNDEIVIVGRFTAVNGVPAEGIAKFDGSSWAAFPTALLGTRVTGLAGDRVVVVGKPATNPPDPRQNVWLQDGTEWVSAVRGVQGLSGLLELQSGDVLGVGGDLPNGLARFDGAYWHAVPFTSFYGGGSMPTRMLELPDGSVVVGGENLLLGADGSFRNIGRLTSTGWDTMSGGLQGSVRALVRMANGDIVAGGDITSAPSFGARNAISRYDGSVWHPLGLGLQRSNGSAGRVDDMVVMPYGRIVVVGDFTTAGGAPARGVAAFDGWFWRQVGGGMPTQSALGGVLAQRDGGPLTLLDGAGQLWELSGYGLPSEHWSQIDTSVLGGPVGSMVALPGGDLLVSGPFASTAEGQVAPFARLAGGSWTTIPAWSPSALAWPPTLDSVGRSGTVYALGDVGQAFTSPYTLGWSTFSSNCAATATSFGASCDGELEALSLPWVGGTFRSRLSWPSGNQALGVIGFAPVVPGLQLSPSLPAAIGCTLDITRDAEVFLGASNNAIEFAMPVPSEPTLVGADFYHQMFPYTLDAQGGLTAVWSTNALHLVVGLL